MSVYDGVNLSWACNPIENQYLVSSRLKKKKTVDLGEL